MDTEQKNIESRLVSHWAQKFKESMVAKAPYTKKWNTFFDAYNGDYFKNSKLPDYKSNLVSNYIFSICETIRPIMLDNDPKFQAMPRHPDGMAYSNDLNETLLYEWDRELMTTKLYRELINCLVTGNYIFFLPWDSQAKEVKAIAVNPFNLFPDPLATTMEDAEYMIYASYHNVNRLKRAFPNKAEVLVGGNINYGELVHDNNKNANTDNQVLVLEVWSRDHEALEEDKKDGKTYLKYPKGRVTTVCPDLGIVLSDKGNPYKDGGFPFVQGKDYDVPGKFWGEGEVSQLLSPQKYMNELNNSILDNAKATANMPWIVDKNAGIPNGGITSRPGLIIRKNQGSEVRREQPPSMPAYVVNAVETYKADMEQISGIFDSLKGNSATGVYTAQGILALQEAGQARIRLKVKLMEETLGRVGQLWLSRMNQFWKEDRWMRMARIDGTYDFKKFKSDLLQQAYDIKILAGSTMPVNKGAMLDFMIRLAQTQMPDGQALVDREAVAQYLPNEVKSALLQRTQGVGLQVEKQFQEMEQAMQEMQEQNGAQMQEMGTGIEELGQQLQQFAQEFKGNDDQTMKVIEEIAGTLEKMGKDVLQTQQENDKIREEKEKNEKENKLKNDSYNSGYKDAESLLAEEAGEGEEVVALGEEDDAGLGLPEDILAGIESLSDDELELLLASNPELAELLQQ
mgnify:CR=1 FL=1